MGLLVLMTYIAIWMVPTRSDLVYASLLDKHNLLLTTPSPRLIFVGGSGIALGLDSALVEEQLGLSVINMGINAGFGLHYMLTEVESVLRQGDIVVIVPEYEHFYGTLLEGDQNLLWALRIRPASIQQTTWRQLLQLAPEIPNFMQQRIQEIVHRQVDPIYNRQAFNAHGDFVNHLALPAQTLNLYAIGDRASLNTNALELLAQFETNASAKGATVLLIYPAIAESFWEYQKNATQIERIHELIERDQIIEEASLPSDFLLPESLFFDTVYHLSGPGRQIRSERIALLLKEKLACNNDNTYCNKAISQQPYHADGSTQGMSIGQATY